MLAASGFLQVAQCTRQQAQHLSAGEHFFIYLQGTERTGHMLTFCLIAPMI